MKYCSALHSVVPKMTLFFVRHLGDSHYACSVEVSGAAEIPAADNRTQAVVRTGNAQRLVILIKFGTSAKDCVGVGNERCIEVRALRRSGHFVYRVMLLCSEPSR